MRCLLVLIFMAFGFAAVSKDAADRAEATLATERVYKIIAEQSTIDAFAAEEGAGDAPPEAAAGRIELRNVSFAYPARRDVVVYRGLSLTIDAGQTVALAGPSGCGKSTLVALLERWYDVDGGALLLDGVDVRALSVRWLRSQIGLVSQEPVLFAGSVGWNIGIGVRAEGRGEGGDGVGGEEKWGASSEGAVTRAAQLANAHGFIRDMPEGYDTQVGEKGVQLSGGQKQRIAIARALVREPSILVLDEATSALDVESERVVQAALDEIMAKQKRTTIVIAHRLSTIRNADKIAVVSSGQVVEEGPHHELVERQGGLYKALVLHSDGAPLPAAS
jgi:ATP-binding cassette subfamily B (MDR/TAP) protein 1